MYYSAEKRFIMVNKLTIIMIFLVILAGGVVRSTGSGMGCPDWPKCFNRLIPPTDVSQLPIDYEQDYINGREKKNERFANTLEKLGFNELAYKIRNDKSILIHEEFNAAKTWTEYINRLTGAVLGIFLLASFVLSFSFLRSKKRIFYLSLFNLFLVFFQAWMGSIVVSTNLTPWVITVHMLIALIILAISIYTYFHAKIVFERVNLLTSSTGVMWLRALAIGMVILTLIQVVIGTDIRESIDIISASFKGENRDLWISKLGDSFLWHRELALVTIILNGLLFFIIRSRYSKNSEHSQIVNAIVLLLIVQIISGLVLAYLGMPAYMQTVHLILSALVFGSQYYLTLLLKKPAII
jgi:cytochrome c oxidase assembly protein subunit 15